MLQGHGWLADVGECKRLKSTGQMRERYEARYGREETMESSVIVEFILYSRGGDLENKI